MAGACVIGAFILSHTSAATSHLDDQPPAGPTRPADAPVETQLVKTGLYLISGGGANTLLRFSADGLILVDGKGAGSYRPLMSQVRRVSKLSDLPVRYLILTNHQADRTANVAQFAAAGVRIISQQNTARRLPPLNAGQEKGPAALTFNRNQMLRFGGVEVQLLHFGAARSDGDTVVYFPNLKVVAVGDLFSSSPIPDFSAGGSLVHWVTVLDDILKLDFDVAVPGSGPPVSRRELESFKTRMNALVSRATDLVNKGVAKDRLMATLKTDDLGWHLRFAGEQLDRFYAELSQRPDTNGGQP